MAFGFTRDHFCMRRCRKITRSESSDSRSKSRNQKLWLRAGDVRLGLAPPNSKALRKGVNERALVRVVPPVPGFRESDNARSF
jgi:hypothetical protein